MTGVFILFLSIAQVESTEPLHYLKRATAPVSLESPFVGVSAWDRELSAKLHAYCVREDADPKWLSRHWLDWYFGRRPDAPKSRADTKSYDWRGEKSLRSFPTQGYFGQHVPMEVR